MENFCRYSPPKLDKITDCDRMIRSDIRRYLVSLHLKCFKVNCLCFKSKNSRYKFPRVFKLFGQNNVLSSWKRFRKKKINLFSPRKVIFRVSYLFMIIIRCLSNFIRLICASNISKTNNSSCANTCKFCPCLSENPFLFKTF